jgi:hypothetical protein
VNQGVLNAVVGEVDTAEARGEESEHTPALLACKPSDLGRYIVGQV